MSTYQLDPSHSSATFSVKHMMIAKVHGGFEKMSGKLEYDSSQPEKSQVQVVIEANSINTREPQRDAHLKSADFFDVEKYQQIIFKSTHLSRSADMWKVVGDLTLHGVTQTISLEMENPSAEMKDPWGNVKMGVSGTTQIKRKDFGLVWNAALETGGVLVGDEVKINLDIQFIKQI